VVLDKYASISCILLIKEACPTVTRRQGSSSLEQDNTKSRQQGKFPNTYGNEHIDELATTNCTPSHRFRPWQYSTGVKCGQMLRQMELLGMDGAACTFKRPDLARGLSRMASSA
jgi:hypothetical protein